jgi:hypothetical protein
MVGYKPIPVFVQRLELFFLNVLVYNKILGAGKINSMKHRKQPCAIFPIHWPLGSFAFFCLSAQLCSFP